MTDLDPIARYAYEQGYNPISFAEMSVRSLVDAHMNVTAGRAADPASFPGYCIDLTSKALASRIVGNLLGAGWTPPGEIVDFEERPS